MTNLDSILKSRDVALPTKVPLDKDMVFPVVMYGCESWTMEKAEGQRIARSNKKAFFSDQCKEIEDKNKMGKTIEISSRALEIPREHFMQRWAQ